MSVRISSRVWLSLLVVAILVAAWRASSQYRGPRLRGRGLEYYFPRWQYEESPEAKTNREPDLQLRAAGLDGIPVLLSALRTEDSRFHTWLGDNWGRVPTLFQSLVPQPIPASVIRIRALEHLFALVTNEVGMRAITNAYPSTPLDVQPDMLSFFGETTPFSHLALPLLSAELKNPDPASSLNAAIAVLRLRPLAAPLVPDAIQALSRKKPEAGPWRGYCELLSSWGPLAASATNALKQCLEVNDPLLWAAAFAALSSIAPDQNGWDKLTYTQFIELGPMGWEAMSRLLVITSFADVNPAGPLKYPIAPVDAKRLIPWFGELIDPKRYTNLLSRVPAHRRTIGLRSSPPGAVEQSIRSDAIRALRVFGPDAAPLIPVLSDVLGDPSRWTRMGAAWTIARVGPAAIPYIDHWRSGLSQVDTAVPLLCLAADCGAGARPLIPLLRTIANGSASLVIPDAAFSPAPRGPGRSGSNRPPMARNENPMPPSEKSSQVLVSGRYLHQHALIGQTYARLAGESVPKFQPLAIDTFFAQRYGLKPPPPGPNPDEAVLARFTVAELASEALRRIEAAVARSASSQPSQ